MKLKGAEDFQNLISKNFGRLTVIEYVGREKKSHRFLCKCDCGKEKIISLNCLGKTLSCGCLRRERISQACFEDLTGKRFDKLEVIRYLGHIKSENCKNKKSKWLCKCDCGKEKIISAGNLKNGTTSSCGCLQKEKTSASRLIDLAGKKFGKLIVISKSKTIKSGQIYWLCRCDCGNEKLIAGNNLNHGKSKSCGCDQGLGNFKHGLSANRKEYRKYLFKDPARKLRHYVSCSINTSLKNRNSSKNNLSCFKFLPYTAKKLKEHLESLWEPWMNWDNYGSNANDERKTWWIDHIIPQYRFPYVSLDDPLFAQCWSLENIRPLEKMANILKGIK